MTNTILVTYASQSGATAGVAEAIGRTLAEKGAAVEVRPVREVKDLSPYAAVVAGSAIQGAKWLPEAMQFLQANRAALAQKPVAVFMVCITLAMRGAEKYRAGLADWFSPVRAYVRPVSEGMFAGTLDFKKMPANFDTLKMRAASALSIFPQGDHRDWNAIRAWAESLSPLLRR